MTISETREKLLSDTAFVITELQKVQTLYELKRVIRYNHNRSEEQHTESVAEHIFGMHCLVDYFLPLEDTEGEWDIARIRTMVQYHDSDEIITGDEIGYRKSAADHANERNASEVVLAKLPTHLAETVRQALDTYESQTTPEAKFVKAIDKIEPVFHLYNETGKTTLAKLRTTKDEHDRIKYPAVEPFPVIRRFAQVMTEQFMREGFYTEE